MRGYKVFNPDWTCRDMQYEVGKTYEMEGAPVICQTGFHFCTKALDCFNYYGFSSENKVAEVEAMGMTVAHDDDSKVSTNKLHIVRELSWHEVLDLVNVGRDNTGLGNSGHWNSGNSNSGNSNSGHSNSGHWNSGDSNSGHRNSGHWNSGDSNSGHWNSGDWNSCDYSAGVFCAKTPNLLIFDKPTCMTLREWRHSKAASLLSRMTLIKWVDDKLITYEYKDACRKMWDGFTIEEKEVIKAIPNFDADKFELITGIRV